MRSRRLAALKVPTSSMTLLAGNIPSQRCVRSLGKESSWWSASRQESPEEIQSGYILKTGPGYPIPNTDVEEAWKVTEDTKYIGMQASAGDLAIFLKSRSHEIEFENEKYIIVPHSSILLLIRDELEV